MEKKRQGFVIEPEEARGMMSSLGLSEPADLLRALVPTAQSMARVPISNFQVGSAGLGSSGRIYLGCNLEFPGLPLHHSVHSEQFLLANASLHREPRLLSIAVSAAPCGHCRQFFQELRHSATPDGIKILVTSDPEPRYLPIVDFLPRPFGPVDLLDSDTPLLLEEHRNYIDFDCGNGAAAIMCNGNAEDHESKAIQAATEAARGAHAPYSGCPSGFAVVDKEGRVYNGSYMESAAYNPSLGPVQAAMVGFMVGGGGGWGGIVGGALVEGEGAKVSYEGTARILFEKVAPDAKIWVRHFTMGGGNGGGGKDV